ncbi:MAG: S1C family serine protease [Agathobacter sp.]|uniref:S1C family serine protease n=1 Tax=Agathobacter sp. TaxID=2021311 RepID=UPI002583849B|nr:S1C family serine protease [Agathobacter sp.]MCR5677131.1 S1C family serine protease [Agathobacter sp.]
MDENKNEFVRETIKDKPINRKKIYRKFLVAAGSAICFAVIFCAITALLLPHLLKRRGLMLAEADTQTATETQPQPTQTQVPETQTQKPDPVVVDPTLSLEDYQKLQTQLYKIGQTANKSIVVITSVTNDTDWFNDSYESEGEGSGVIISENSKVFYILTEQKLIHGSDGVRVTFIDNTTVDAQVIGADKNIGLAVIAVKKDDMQDTTLGRVAIAKTGSSASVTPGTMVIALGSPLGSSFSVLTGTVTATNLEASIVDHNFKVFSTDIVSNSSGSGILINTDGEMIGVVMQGISDEGNTITAVTMTNLETMIDLLTGGKTIPSLGLSVSTVTSKIANEYNLPTGVYIKSVQMESLGAKAGLQVGDIITQMNGEEITTADQYGEVLLAIEQGSTLNMVVQRKGADGYADITYKITIGEK